MMQALCLLCICIGLLTFCGDLTLYYYVLQTDVYKDCLALGSQTGPHAQEKTHELPLCEPRHCVVEPHNAPGRCRDVYLRTKTIREARLDDQEATCPKPCWCQHGSQSGHDHRNHEGHTTQVERWGLSLRLALPRWYEKWPRVNIFIGRSLYTYRSNHPCKYVYI